MKMNHSTLVERKVEQMVRERAFGVLHAKWNFFATPRWLWKKDEMMDIISCCVIFQNKVAKENRLLVIFEGKKCSEKRTGDDVDYCFSRKGMEQESVQWNTIAVLCATNSYRNST